MRLAWCSRSSFVPVLSLVFELGKDAFVNFNILPCSQINWLIQGIALSKGVKEPDLDDLTYLRNAEVGRDGHIANRDPAFAVE